MILAKKVRLLSAPEQKSNYENWHIQQDILISREYEKIKNLIGKVGENRCKFTKIKFTSK